jgi:hypothetical protein
LLATAILGGCIPNPTPTPPPADTAVSDVAVLTQATGPLNRHATVVFGVEFDQPVNGFDDATADVQLTHNGTGGGQLAIFPISGQAYVVVVTEVTGDGSFQLTVPAGAAQDANGNLSPAGLSSAVLVDNTPPQVARIGSQALDGRYGVGPLVDVVVDFSEPVTLEGTFEIALNTGQRVEYAAFASLAQTSAIYTVQAGDNADPLDSTAIAAGSGARLLDAAGNVGQFVLPAATLASGHNIIIDTTAPVAGLVKTSTTSLAKLTGTVDDPAAVVIVSVAGNSYIATNNGDGTWSLSELAVPVPLPDGTYDVTVTASDTVGNVGTATVTAALTIDGTAPLVIVTRQTTYDRTPTLTGAVDDAEATVQVTVAGNTYTAENNGNGTWTLNGFLIDPPLENGTYDVAVEATDPAGNVGRDTTTDELMIDG